MAAIDFQKQKLILKNKHRLQKEQAEICFSGKLYCYQSNSSEVIWNQNYRDLYAFSQLRTD
jgi:hypothetical protein